MAMYNDEGAADGEKAFEDYKASSEEKPETKSIEELYEEACEAQGCEQPGYEGYEAHE